MVFMNPHDTNTFPFIYYLCIYLIDMIRYSYLFNAYCLFNRPEFPTASQVALKPFLFTEPSLWKVTVIVFPELRIGLGSMEPQYFCWKDPWVI